MQTKYANKKHVQKDNACFTKTGSPVFRAGFFSTLSRLICCFRLCCIWHFPFSLIVFHRSIFSTYYFASFQLAFFLAWVLHLSNVPLSKLHLLFPFFLHLQLLPLFKLHFASHVFLHVLFVPLSELYFQIPCFFALFLHVFKM